MNIEQLKTEAGELILKALNGQFTGEDFSYIPGEPLCDEPEMLSIEAVIVFEHENCKQKHHITIGWSEDDGIGFEIGEDCDLLEITRASAFAVLYYHIALEGEK